jgi:hypothetical protein
MRVNIFFFFFGGGFDTKRSPLTDSFWKKEEKKKSNNNERSYILYDTLYLLGLRFFFLVIDLNRPRISYLSQISCSESIETSFTFQKKKKQL